MNTAARTSLRKLWKDRTCNAFVLTLAWTACDHSDRQTAPASRPSSANSVPLLGVPCAERSLPLRRDVSYVQFRQLLYGLNTVLLTQGTPCSGPEREECLASVAKFEHYTTTETDSRCDDLVCPMDTYAIVVRRGRPELLTTPSDLRELLGTIDTLDEAWLMAISGAKAVWPLCEQPEMSAYRRHGASFELRQRRYTNRCPLTLSETTYEVASNGTVAASKPVVVSVLEDGCVHGPGGGLVAP